MSSLRVLACVAVLGLVGVFILACGDVSTTTSASKSGSLGSGTPVLTPPSHFKVGSHVQIGNEWMITINKVNTFGGGTFDAKPGPGDTYLLIDLTMKNISQAQQNTSQYDYSLRALNGDKEKQPFLFDYNNYGGNLTPGEQAHGKIPFEIPTKVHQYILSFAPAATYPVTTLAEWDIILS